MDLEKSQMNNNIRQDYYYFIDSAKGMVIILMLVGHSTPPVLFKQIIYGFHMPFFFIISGFIYNLEKNSKMSFKEYLKSKARRLLIPYFVYSILNLVINIPVELSKNKFDMRVVIEHILTQAWGIVYSYGTATQTPNCTPLWFLPCIFISYVIVFLTLKINNPTIRNALFLTYFVADYLTYVYYNMIMPWHFNVAFLGAFFMFVGIQIKEKAIIEKISSHYIFVICCMIIGLFSICNNSLVGLNGNVINNPFLFLAGSIMVSLCIIAVFKKISCRNKFLELLGKNTIIVMAFNYAINTYSVWLLTKTNFIREGKCSWWLISIIDVCTLLIIIYVKNEILRKGLNNT